MCGWARSHILMGASPIPVKFNQQQNSKSLEEIGQSQITSYRNYLKLTSFKSFFIFTHIHFQLQEDYIMPVKKSKKSASKKKPVKKKTTKKKVTKKKSTAKKKK